MYIHMDPPAGMG